MTCPAFANAEHVFHKPLGHCSTYREDSMVVHPLTGKRIEVQVELFQLAESSKRVGNMSCTRHAAVEDLGWKLLV